MPSSLRRCPSTARPSWPTATTCRRGQHIGSALTALGAKGSADEVLRLATVPGVTAPVVVLTGLGDAAADASSFDAEVLRRAAGAATRALSGVPKVAVSLPGTGAASVAAVAEGSALGCYRYAGVRGEKAGAADGGRAAKTAKAKAEKAAGPASVTVVTADARDRAVKAAAKRGHPRRGHGLRTGPGQHPAQQAVPAVLRRVREGALPRRRQG